MTPDREPCRGVVSAARSLFNLTLEFADRVLVRNAGYCEHEDRYH